MAERQGIGLMGLALPPFEHVGKNGGEAAVPGERLVNPDSAVPLDERRLVGETQPHENERREAQVEIGRSRRLVEGAEGVLGLAPELRGERTAAFVKLRELVISEPAAVTQSVQAPSRNGQLPASWAGSPCGQWSKSADVGGVRGGSRNAVSNGS